MAESRQRWLVPLLTVAITLGASAYLVYDLMRAGRVVFKTPWALLLLLAVPLTYYLVLVAGPRRRAVFSYSNTGVLARLRTGLVARLAPLPAVCRVVAVLLLAFALGRPQTRDRAGHVEVEGIDIVLALDLSRSMEATDLMPNRLEAAKRVIDDFIVRRKSDRIGLVIFGREAFTHCPLTLDYSVLRTMLGELQLGLIDGAGTAIGNALGVSLARLRASDAKSRVVILLTDGDSNAGNVTPETAARYAAAMKVKVFTILVGADASTSGGRDAFGRPIRVAAQYPVNPKLLEQMAAQTGGRAYRATDRRALDHNFEQILDELDKSTRREVAAVFLDAYRPFLAVALALLLLELLMGMTRWRRFP